MSDNLNHSPQKPSDEADTPNPIASESPASDLNGGAAADPTAAPPPAASDAPPNGVAPAHAATPLEAATETELKAAPPKSAKTKSASKPNEPEPENFWVEMRNILLLSIALALGIRHFVAEARYIPSESMLPTLEINDRLIVEKMSYRFRQPERGDVVVFRPTDTIKAENPTFNDALIKRIVGLPGETIEVKDGRVFVDGEPIVENYIDEEPAYVWGPQEISEDSYLVLGDNRNNSYDSHFWGFVPKDNLIGRAAVRVWPPNRLGPLDEQPAFYFEGDAEEVSPTPAAE